MASAAVWFLDRSFISVVLHEDTASGAEIFPVLIGDGGIGIDADGPSSGFTDHRFGTIVGVDDDEDAIPVVVADADFEPRRDPVVVDDIVHVRFPLGLRGLGRLSPTGILYHTPAGSQPTRTIYPKLWINCG